MIPQKLIEQAREFAYPLYKEYGVPNIFQVDYAIEKGLNLAAYMSANREVVLLVMILMDSQLGPALKLGKPNEHVRMAEEKANELFVAFSELTNDERENILCCIREHHGVEKFHSIESEVVCNADCYKFVSVAGVVGGIKNSRDMSLEDLVKLYLVKADEKWNALSLDICKQELEPQYKAIKSLLSLYKS